MSDSEQNSGLKLQALYTIFEKHLYDFEDNAETEAALIDKIVGDYLNFLSTQQVVVPKKWRMQIIDELRHQVHQMLVKKMYGCLSVEEFLMGEGDRADKRKKSRKKYSKLF